MSTDLVVQEQENVVESMTKALRRIYHDGAERLAKGDAAFVLTRYDIGAELIEIEEDEEKYGKAAVRQLAIAWGVSSSPDSGANMLYAWRAIASRWSRDQVKALLDRRGVRQTTICLEHLIELNRIRSDKDLTKYTERIFEEGLTAGDLASEITAKLDRKRSSSGGRKPTPPRSPMAGLQQIVEMTKTFVGRSSVWESGIFHKLEEAAPSTIDESILSKLEQVQAQQQKMIKTSKSMVARIEACAARVRRVLAKSGEQKDAKVKAKSSKKKKAKKAKARPVASA